MRDTRLHNWLIYRVLNRELERAAKHARGKLLDIGCGTKPYRAMFAPYVTKHVGIDLVDTIHPKLDIDVFGSIHTLPFVDESFDTILCTEVLEHVEEPRNAVAEMYRVLKKGGCCILSTPFFWHVHEAPRDFYRFSRYGLRYLFEVNGYTIVEIKAVSGFWVTVTQEMAYYVAKFRESWPLRIPVLLFIWAIQKVGYIFDALDRDENFATEHIIIARKSK